MDTSGSDAENLSRSGSPNTTLPVSFGPLLVTFHNPGGVDPITEDRRARVRYLQAGVHGAQVDRARRGPTVHDRPDASGFYVPRISKPTDSAHPSLARDGALPSRPYQRRRMNEQERQSDDRYADLVRRARAAGLGEDDGTAHRINAFARAHPGISRDADTQRRAIDNLRRRADTLYHAYVGDLGISHDEALVPVGRIISGDQPTEQATSLPSASKLLFASLNAGADSVNLRSLPAARTARAVRGTRARPARNTIHQSST